MASSNSSSDETVFQQLEDQLKCEVCESGPRFGKSHWYRCMGLHHICQDCKETDEKTKCSCGQLISHAFDKMTDTLLKAKTTKFKCENVRHGCNEKLEGQAMESHQAECIYRLVFCPSVAHFEHKIVYHQLLEHMEEFSCYSGEFKLTGKMEVDKFGPIKENSRMLSKIEHDGRFFFLYGVVINDILMHGIFFYGSAYEAKNYVYTIEFYGKEESISKLVFEGNVTSVDKSIIAETKGLAVNLDHFKSEFIDAENNVKAKFSIRNLKDEIKDDNVESGVSDTD